MRIIGHLDMDAFFAAIEERDSQQFRGLPLVVGADPQDGQGRGVVSTANYKARQYGIRSAMPISRAWRLSEEAKKSGQPAAIFLPVNLIRYEQVAVKIFSILRRYAQVVEEASIDEAYFDLSQTGSFEHALALARKIKKEIKEKERLTASIGLGPNKLIAKITSDFQKPDGLTSVTEKMIPKFLDPLPLRKIPGIGPKTETLFSRRGIKTVGEAKKIKEEEFYAMLGKNGLEIYKKLRGFDESPLVEQYQAKTIGEQKTFLIDTRDSLFIFEQLKELCRHIFERLKQGGFNRFRTVVVTVRFADFETKSHARTLDEPAGALSVLEFEAMKSLLPFLDRRANPKRKAIRLIGFRVEKLS